MVHNLNELEEIVGPLPFDIESGIAHTLEWIRIVLTQNEFTQN